MGAVTRFHKINDFFTQTFRNLVSGEWFPSRIQKYQKTFRICFKDDFRQQVQTPYKAILGSRKTFDQKINSIQPQKTGFGLLNMRTGFDRF